jgi:hypothetical protein
MITPTQGLEVTRSVPKGMVWKAYGEFLVREQI